MVGALDPQPLPHAILGDVLEAAAEFSPSAVLPVLRQACEQTGLSSEDAQLLRLGENALFRLADAPIVVRIARSADRLARVERELCIARWLAASGVPAVRVCEEIRQPLLVAGYPVSFWRAVTGGGPEPTHLDLALLLARFHSLLGRPCDLGAFDPLGTLEFRLANATNVDPTDRDFLDGRRVVLGEQLKRLEFALPLGPIHGDAHTSNLLTDNGQVVLIDFEAAAFGPREWDLMPMAIGRERFGMTERDYRDFTEAYGFDVRTWPGYPVLRQVRELTMTTWLMQNVGHSDQIAAEFAMRVESMRREDAHRVWHAF